MDASTTYFREEMEVQIEGKDVPIEVAITEAGNIEVNVVDTPQYPLSKELSDNLRTIEGTTTEDESVELSNVVVSMGLNADHQEGSYRFINSMSTPTEIVIDGTDGYVSHDGEEVGIRFDVLGFKHFIPHETVDNINLIERGTWRADASPISGLDERIEYIKAHKILLRTAELTIRQELSGDIAHQVAEAREKLEDLLSLSGFVQGLGPTFVRCELADIADESVDNVDGGIRFTKLWATQGAIGGAFKSERLVWGNGFPKFLDTAYDEYNNHVKDDLRVRYALGYYWDALNTTRPVEGRFLSVCSAIELLAKRYSDLYNQQSRTQDRIEYLIDELNVETRDLADFAGTSSRTVSQKYFYSYSRQYVVHGDNNPTWDELRKDFEAALTLLQRIFRNQLVGSLDGDPDFETLSELQPQSSIEFQ